MDKTPRTPTDDAPPSCLLDRKNAKRYSCGKLLGEGGFARCYEVSDETGKRFAAKMIRKASLVTQKQKNKLFAEIKIHQMMSHSSIVQFLSVFEDEDNVYLILELCENKTLTLVDLLKTRRRLTEPEVRYYMWILLDGVRYMHQMRVIHRDLKLGNMFLSSNMAVKIGDFGLAAILHHDGERKKTICGTPNYIAPEVLFDSQTGHSFEVDLWSLGVVMYTLLIGKPPFQTKDVKAIYKNIRNNAYEFPGHIPVSDKSRAVIVALLNSRPECRPAIQDLMVCDFFSEPLPVELPVTALKQVPTIFKYHVAEMHKSSSKFSRDSLFASAAKHKGPFLVEDVKSSLVSSLTSDNASPLLRTVLSDKATFCNNLKSPPDPEKVSILSAKAALNRNIGLKSSGGVLENTMLAISRALSQTEIISTTDLDQPAHPVFITKWIDYSNKYGLGYQLRDGTIGVYFNDSTSILLAANKINVEYLCYGSGVNSAKLLRRAFTVEAFPKDLQKKVTLLQHFGMYMKENLFKSTALMDETEQPREKDMIFLTKFLKTRHGVMFRLSNHVVQLNLFDHTKLILSNGGKIVTYFDKSRNSETRSIEFFIGKGDREVLDRLQYAKEVICQLISSKLPHITPGTSP